MSAIVDSMFELVASAEFEDWLNDLRDMQAKARVLARLDRVAGGNFGDAKALGRGIAELRIPYGPGYRVYYKVMGTKVVLLLCGGDKSTQTRDISHAGEIAANFKE